MSTLLRQVLGVYEDIKSGIARFRLWRKRRYEDKVDKVIASRDERGAGKLMRDIASKRDKRHKES